jgi:hypothetical protein
LPDLSGYNSQDFDLALQFDIRRYVDILAASDSVSDLRKTLGSRPGRETTVTQMPHTKLKETAANTLAPADEEWGRWE